MKYNRDRSSCWYGAYRRRHRSEHFSRVKSRLRIGGFKGLSAIRSLEYRKNRIRRNSRRVSTTCFHKFWRERESIEDVKFIHHPKQPGKTALLPCLGFIGNTVEFPNKQLSHYFSWNVFELCLRGWHVRSSLKYSTSVSVSVTSRRDRKPLRARSNLRTISFPFYSTYHAEWRLTVCVSCNRPIVKIPAFTALHCGTDVAALTKTTVAFFMVS